MKHSLEKNLEINIGIIGPEALKDKTKEALKSFPNFKPVFVSLESLDNVKEATKEIIFKVDVILYTEYHLFCTAKQLIDFQIPVHHFPLMGTGLYRSLSLIKSNSIFNSLSIDTIDKNYVEQVLFDLEIDKYTYSIFNNRSQPSLIETITTFHIENYKNNNAIAVTGIQEVSNELSKTNIPNEWVTPTHQDMIVSLERALLATETRRNKESQIVFGLINIDNFAKVTEKYSSEHEVQLLKLKIQQMLLDYTKQLDGHLINLGGEEYSFLTTRGIFERETRGYKFMPILQDMKNEIGVTLSIGVGFGRTAAESGSHARLALRQSKELDGNVCYIVREDRSVLGPVDVLTHKHYERYDLSVTDIELLDKAEKAGMSAAYMTKLMARVARHKKYDYTAQELASTLNITIRSTHRILLKWMDAEIVEIIGEEKLNYKGRPRRIYRLKFILDENKNE